jgi:ABC-type polysaccharide/polyol phosphate transport system ATPase subunit
MADVGAFLDAPVKRWSTGMRLKLAVALVLHLPADVLLLDEGLAVGDAAFRGAALERLAALEAQGRALLLVSHEPELLAPVCDRVVWLEAGRVREVGPTSELLAAYAR